MARYSHYFPSVDHTAVKTLERFSRLWMWQWCCWIEGRLKGFVFQFLFYEYLLQCTIVASVLGIWNIYISQINHFYFPFLSLPSSLSLSTCLLPIATKSASLHSALCLLFCSLKDSYLGFSVHGNIQYLTFCARFISLSILVSKCIQFPHQ